MNYNASHALPGGWMEATEIVKRVNEQKRRAASTSEAVRKARKAIRARQQFVPKQVNVRAVELDF